MTGVQTCALPIFGIFTKSRDNRQKYNLISYSEGWVNHNGGSGANGWNLAKGDKFYVGDFNGDGKKEMVVLNKKNEWIGFIEIQNMKLVAGWIGFDWVNHKGQTGNNGWNLRLGDKFTVMRKPNNKPDKISVVSKDSKWMGILERYNNKLVAQRVWQP